MFLLAGIAAANDSHVKYFPTNFPSRGAYDALYEIMLRVVNIASEEFTTYVQELVVRPSPPRSLGSTLAWPRSHSTRSTGLSLPALAASLTQPCSRSAALLLGRALSASLTQQRSRSVALSLRHTHARLRSAWLSQRV
jgi:hypothetical protein